MKLLQYLLFPLLIQAQTRSTFKARDHSVKSVAIDHHVDSVEIIERNMGEAKNEPLNGTPRQDLVSPHRKPEVLNGKLEEIRNSDLPEKCECDEAKLQQKIDLIVRQRIDEMTSSSPNTTNNNSKVFHTEHELLNTSIQEGHLAFALDSQRLFIRTKTGFGLVKLEETILDPLPRPPPPRRPPQPCRPRTSPQALTGGLSYQTCRYQQEEFPHTLIDEEQYRIFNIRPNSPLINDGLVGTIKLVPLNRPVSGLAGGVEGLDRLCRIQANESGIRGEFRALVGTKDKDPQSLIEIPQNTWPVVNIYGARLFDSWDRVFGDVSLQSASLYTFDKRNVLHNGAWSDGWLWHGVEPASVDWDPQNCLDWRSGDSVHFAWASPLSAHRPLFSHAQKASCSIKMVVLCVGI